MVLFNVQKCEAYSRYDAEVEYWRDVDAVIVRTPQNYPCFVSSLRGAICKATCDNGHYVPSDGCINTQIPPVPCSGSSPEIPCSGGQIFL